MLPADEGDVTAVRGNLVQGVVAEGLVAQDRRASQHHVHRRRPGPESVQNQVQLPLSVEHHEHPSRGIIGMDRWGGRVGGGKGPEESVTHHGDGHRQVRLEGGGGEDPVGAVPGAGQGQAHVLQDDRRAFGRVETQPTSRRVGDPGRVTPPPDPEGAGAGAGRDLRIHQPLKLPVGPQELNLGLSVGHQRHPPLPGKGQ